VGGQGEVNVDMDHHRAVLESCLKVNPQEVVVGWSVSNSYTLPFYVFFWWRKQLLKWRNTN
jgi:translation initiation factor 3 subunit F